MGRRQRRGRARSDAIRPPDDRTKEPKTPAQPAARDGFGRIERTIAIGVLIASAALLFTRLGHYALWDDEAINALHAIGVWRTGDTTAVIGDNIVGYRGGAPLVGLRERYTPPLGFYLAAPALGLLGPSAWAARLPFALCGLAAVAVLLLGLKEVGADRTTWILMAEAIVGNVSFFLYCRQCRYYGAAILLTTALGYLYVFRDGRRRTLVAFALLSVLLLAANYLNFAALYACLAADYLLWGRKRRPLATGDWPWLVVPQVLLGVPIVLTWNPIGKDVIPYQSAHWLAEKATLFWWNWRELDRCEFGVLPLILLAFWLYARTGRDVFLRLPVAALLYVTAVTAASPQPVGANLVCRRPIPGADDPALDRARRPGPARARSPAHPGRLAGDGRLRDEPVARGVDVRLGPEVNPRLVRRGAGPADQRSLRRRRPMGQRARPARRLGLGPAPPHDLSPDVPRPEGHLRLAVRGLGRPPAPGTPADPLPRDGAAGLRRRLRPRRVGARAAACATGRAVPLRARRRARDMSGKTRFRPELFWRRFRPIPVRDPATEGIHIFRRVEPPIAPRRPRGSA